MRIALLVVLVTLSSTHSRAFANSQSEPDPIQAYGWVDLSGTYVGVCQRQGETGSFFERITIKQKGWSIRIRDRLDFNKLWNGHRYEMNEPHVYQPIRASHPGNLLTGLVQRRDNSSVLVTVSHYVKNESTPGMSLESAELLTTLYEMQPDGTLRLHRENRQELSFQPPSLGSYASLKIIDCELKRKRP